MTAFRWHVSHNQADEGGEMGENDRHDLTLPGQGVEKAALSLSKFGEGRGSLCTADRFAG